MKHALFLPKKGKISQKNQINHKSAMNDLHNRIQSIRIGKRAPDKISSYFEHVTDAMKVELTEEELKKMEGILAKVDKEFKWYPKTSKSRKITDVADDQCPKRARKRTFNGYGLFLKQTCDELTAQKFSGNYLLQVSVLWRTLTDDEKNPWHEKARVANLATKESAEVPETSTDLVPWSSHSTVGCTKCRFSIRGCSKCHGARNAKGSVAEPVPAIDMNEID